MPAARPRKAPARWAADLGLLLLAALLLYLYVDPYSNPETINSDAAVAVVQAAAHGLDRSDVFMWGQDRLGAFNFLLARALITWPDLSGYVSHAFFLQALYCLYLAAAFLVLLAGARPAVKALLLLAALLPLWLEPGPFFRFALMIDQVYPPQLFFLAAALVLMARIFLEGPRGARGVGLALCLGLCLILGLWMNPANVLFLGGGLAAMGAWALTGRRELWPRLAGLAVALFLAALVYQYLTLISSAHWTAAFASRAIGLTPPDLILDGVGRFLGELWRHLPYSRWLLVPAALLGLAALFPWPTRLAEWQPSPADRLVLAGLWLGALAYLALLGGLMHFRINFFHPRYTVPLWFLGAASLALVLKKPLARLPGPSLWAAALVMAAVALSQGWAVQQRTSPELTLTRELAADAPDIGVVGRYWNSLVYSFFYPQKIDATPLQEDNARSVAQARRILARPLVLVNFSRWRDEQHAAPDPRDGQPPRYLDQFGLRLELMGLYRQQGHQKWYRYRPAGRVDFAESKYAVGSALLAKPLERAAAEIFGQTGRSDRAMR